MIEELLTALVESGADAGPEELADILWLATQISTEGREAHTTGSEQPSNDAQLTDPPADPDRADSGSQAGERYYSAAHKQHANAADSNALSGEAVLVRRAMALDNPLGVMRALRPLGRRTVPGVTRTELDEELSVNNSAEHGIVVPILKPQRGRWLDLALVIDTHHSMLLWHDLVSELRRTIAQTGIFRDVRVWFLSGTEAGGTPTVARATADESRRPQEVADPSGHRLVLVVTDTVAQGWSGTNLEAVLRQWAAHNPLAILNVLPRRLWSRGAVPPSGLLVRAARPAAPNVSWRLAPASRRGGRDRSSSRGRDRERLVGSIAIPMMETSPAGLRALASLVAGEGRWSRLPSLTISRTPTGVEPTAAPVLSASQKPDAIQVLRRFQESASPIAQELAGYLSAVPLTLPVMTLIRRAMLPHSEHGHIVEVALGGLFERWQGGHRTLDMARYQFEFLPGVREALLGAQLRHEITTVQELVRRDVAEYLERLPQGSGGDFPAMRTRAGDTGTRKVGPGAIPFAQSALPRGMPISETRPLSLGVHPSELAGDAADQIPTYVEREHDAPLRDIVHPGFRQERRTVVVLVGNEGSGKTRSAWEAVRRLPDDWVLWAPPTVQDLEKGMPLIRPRTVVWLDDLERFGLADLTQYDGAQPPVMMVGTVLPQYWENPICDVFRRRAMVIHVPDRLSEREAAKSSRRPSRSAPLQEAKARFAFKIPGGAITMASFPAPEGHTHLVTYNRTDAMARSWDVETGRMVGTPFRLQSPGIVAIATVPQRTGPPLIAGINYAGEVHLWDSRDGSSLGVRYVIHPMDVLSMTEFPDAGGSPLLATIGYGGRVHLWDATNGTPVGRTNWTGAFPGRAMSSLVDSTGRRHLATADYSGTVRLWDLQYQPPAHRELCAIRPPKVLAMAGIDRSGQHSLLATIGYDEVIRIWDPFEAPSSNRSTEQEPGVLEAVRYIREPRISQMSRIVEVLSSYPQMQDRSTRELLVASLRPEIAALAPRSAAMRVDILGIVMTAVRYYGGLEELLKAILEIDDDLHRRRELFEAVRELSAEREGTGGP
ncbi:SAV_2336 N-terminal domain-related protein [Streptomyces mirabilis]|uniref:SAV_2336 N-terminal domain-related protein n=1 Tax=Streptomyces mirabilis TaxID=68239 RepID=UPI00368D3567